MKPPAPSTDKPPLRNKNGTFSETEIAAIISGACDFVASFRGDHWHRTPKQCEPLARPLEQALSRMSPAMAKKMAELSLPVSIMIGAVTVFGPAVNEEINIAKLIAADKEQNSRTTSSGNFSPNPSEPFYTEGGFAGNGYGGRAGTAPGAGDIVSDLLR